MTARPQPKEPTMEQLAAAKIEARRRLLKLPPKEAQAKVDGVLHPDLWTIDVSQYEWEPSLPSADND